MLARRHEMDAGIPAETAAEAPLRAALLCWATCCLSAKCALSESVAGCRLFMAMALPVRGSLATNVNKATRLGSSVSPCSHSVHLPICL